MNKSIKAKPDEPLTRRVFALTEINHEHQLLTLYVCFVFCQIDFHSTSLPTLSSTLIDLFPGKLSPVRAGSSFLMV